MHAAIFFPLVIVCLVLFVVDVGQVLSFPGGAMLHGGEPVTRGRRYILAVFAYLAGEPHGRSEGGSDETQGAKAEGVDRAQKRPARDDCTGFGNVQWKVPRAEEAADERSGGIFNFSF
jgi:hypothetical protein